PSVQPALSSSLGARFAPEPRLLHHTPPSLSLTARLGRTRRTTLRRSPAHVAGGRGAPPADWAGSARRCDISDQRGGIRGSGGGRRLRRRRRWERAWRCRAALGGCGGRDSGAARPECLAMTRGNQRELARQKNLKKTQEIHKGKRKEDSLSASQRKQRDSEIMQQKQKAANERKSLQAGTK
uniref:Small EDRK-rich factor-like N-terminal domain-containing protein n=8 Tax=Passeriformes TaxID=9126 RepID=U3KCU2_FICAL